MWRTITDGDYDPMVAQDDGTQINKIWNKQRFNTLLRNKPQMCNIYIYIYIYIYRHTHTHLYVRCGFFGSICFSFLNG